MPETHHNITKSQKESDQRIPFNSIDERDDNGMEFLMDRPLPFLVLYRTPPGQKDRYTYYLGKTEASFFTTGNLSDVQIMHKLSTYVDPLANHFGAFLLLEIWVPKQKKEHEFTIHSHKGTSLPLIKNFKKKLSNLQVEQQQFEVIIDDGDRIEPEGLKPLSLKQLKNHKEIIHIGLEISPSWYNEHNEHYYPVYLRNLRATFSKALKQLFYEFIRLETNYKATHFEMLGLSSLNRDIFELDDALEALNNEFEILNLVTPTNIKSAWKKFQEDDYRVNPIFHYAHLPVDPEIVKRKLFKLRIDKIEDPTFGHIFRDKRDEISKMVSMLANREQDDFIYSSQLLYGHVDDATVNIASALLVAIPTPKNSSDIESDYDSNDDDTLDERINATQFIELANKEIKELAKQNQAIQSEIITTKGKSLKVAHGQLHVGKELDIDAHRAEALIQHEIGTHMVTYYNGKVQPLKLFYCGVPGYEDLQEGLAVLSEYIVGGLTNGRLRTLAARVIAVHQLIKGADFKATFELLHQHYKFKPYTAYTITMRVYRGGGFTKDAVYLRGLLKLLGYIHQGNDISPLLIGKIKQEYLPVVQELQHRSILSPLSITPHYLTDQYAARIAEIKNGLTLFKMIN